MGYTIFLLIPDRSIIIIILIAKHQMSEYSTRYLRIISFSQGYINLRTMFITSLIQIIGVKIKKLGIPLLGHTLNCANALICPLT